MMMVKLNGELVNMSIYRSNTDICQMPTTGHDDEEVYTVYEKL
jgi:hypothetical protein